MLPAIPKFKKGTKVSRGLVVLLGFFIFNLVLVFIYRDINSSLLEPFFSQFGWPDYWLVDQWSSFATGVIFSLAFCTVVGACLIAYKGIKNFLRDFYLSALAFLWIIAFFVFEYLAQFYFAEFTYYTDELVITILGPLMIFIFLLSPIVFGFVYARLKKFIEPKAFLSKSLELIGHGAILLFIVFLIQDIFWGPPWVYSGYYYETATGFLPLLIFMRTGFQYVWVIIIAFLICLGLYLGTSKHSLLGLFSKNKHNKR